MNKPTEEQVGEAGQLIKDHFRQYGNTASESRLASLVYSILSHCTGDGKPAAAHADALEAARQARKLETAKPETPPDNKEPGEGRETEGEWTRDELQTMTVAALKELAAEGEVSLAGRATKDEIIDAIMSAD